MKNEQSIIKQNLSFYDEIAEQYDEILEQDAQNALIREKVADIFSKLVLPGMVLDFGGGTGKDLSWLTKKGYPVIFCEPSANMRAKAVLFAKRNLPGSDIIFLNNTEADFVNWSAKLPFLQKMDGVLANFAVINNIPDLKLLFKNLSLVMKQGGLLLMLVLKSDFKKRWRSNRFATIRSIFTGTTVTVTVKFYDRNQSVYLYTTTKIKKMASPHFHFEKKYLINADGFELIQLIRK